MKIVLLGATALVVVSTVALSANRPPDRPTAGPPSCDPAVQVPTGFCAVLVAEGLRAPRHIVVALNGDIFAASNRGGVIALRDSDGDGVAETRKEWGREGGTGIALAEGYLWFAANETIYRWKWAPGQLEPTEAAEVVVQGLPSGGHTAKPIVVKDGFLYVDFGSGTNSCQLLDRSARSPGQMPCAELGQRAGIWRFSSTRIGQSPSEGIRFATGLRNPMALAIEPTTGALWMATHGRDQLGDNWGFSDSLNAELPAEEFGPVPQGADYGWPYCYYDELKGVKVQSPEYGGDGIKVGDCGTKRVPAIGFPGHWAPIGLTFYGANSFPVAYRGARSSPSTVRGTARPSRRRGIGWSTSPSVMAGPAARTRPSCRAPGPTRSGRSGSRSGRTARYMSDPTRRGRSGR